ncbi:hypothetical protein ACS0TY_026775 [Phlomoides rotata]
MVSIRRRKLLALYPGQNSLLDPLSRAFEHGLTRLTPDNWGESKKPVGVHHLPLNEETTSATAQGSPDLDASTPSKEHLFQKFPEVRRRKRHRRKHVENQEACTMRGVYYKNRKWQAAIKVDKKQIHLGTVSSEEEAARLYDRAAFMCGREPNFALSEEEKQELRQYKWEEFLAITRSAITNKRQRGAGPDSRRKLQTEDWEVQSSFSASEDDMLAS